jgi:spore maturation protein SpmA
MLNYIWLGLIVGAVLIGGFNGKLKEVADGGIAGSKVAVEIAIGLIGLMALWLGIMRLAERSGMVQVFARVLRPVMVRLFPDVPAQHPAMGSMLMNMAANMLGLSNAATPLGLRAMKDLETLNPRQGTATNAMCTFLAINTSSIQLIPMTAVAILAGAGSKQPYAIIGTAFMATVCSTVAGISVVKFLEKMPWYRLPPVPTATEQKAATEERKEEAKVEMNTAELAPINMWSIGAICLFFALLLWFFLTMSFPEMFGRLVTEEIKMQSPLVRCLNAISLMSIPVLLAFFPLYASLRKVKVYEEFVEGAKEGFNVAIKIIPYLVAILVAVAMFRGAGGIDMMSRLLKPALDMVGFPVELLPMTLMRPLSGSGTLGLFTELVKQFGPDSIIARMAGTIFGSTETTFYVIAVYFGAVSVKRTRHAVPAGLIADLVGVIASIIICRMVFK